MTKSSRISGFYKRSPEERADAVAEFAGLSDEQRQRLSAQGGLALVQADRMIENVIGLYALPLGVATNFRLNGRDLLIPMAIEEPSVVAGLSYAARMARQAGGFHADSDPPEMIGQIQILDVADPAAARMRLLSEKKRLLALANEQDPVIVGLGGGARDVVVRRLATAQGEMLALHLIYDARDAMGANTVNTAMEAIAPLVAEISGGRVGLRILSNLADRRLARAWATVPKEALALHGLTPEEGVQRILEAYAFAAADPYRAATHNKGIMNGIDAVVIATGNDWRAIEAGAHAYATRDGRYRPLSAWERDAAGNLVGSIELPLAAGTVGGATRAHPMAGLALEILGVESAGELAQVLAAVGLAQNLAALRALAMEGIQEGHMKLHARQIALSVGAEGDEVPRVVEALVASGKIRMDEAQRVLSQLRQDG